MRALGVIFLFVFWSFIRPAFGAATDADAACRPYFGRACSDAMGRWLPKFRTRRAFVTPTTVVDEIVDPAGRGEFRFLRQRGVYRGTLFVYGTAGPPKGHAVYDPVRKIAFFDEGCCAWHHVVVASNVPPPPKTIVRRSLAEIRTKHGIRLGDPRSVVAAIYGPALTYAVPGSADQTMVSYSRVEKYLPCEAVMSFVFVRDRLTAMDFTAAC